MITEDYVKFSTAKLLKEKGFDVPSSAPTQALVVKWLRVKHSIHIYSGLQFEPEIKDEVEEKEFLDYIYFIFNIPKMRKDGDTVLPYINNTGDFMTSGFSTPERAIEAAIIYCLNHLV